MKKRVLLALFLAIIVLFVLKYVIGVFVRQPILPKDLSALVPPDPLAYLHCSQLKLRRAQLLQSADYQRFIQSEFVTHLQHTAWWPAAMASFEEIWHSLIIDPLHIIGSDFAIGVYQRGADELLPGVIVISKLDSVAKIAEQLFYAFDKISGQTGLSFVEEYQDIPLYMFKQPEMLLPLYYTIIDHVGMISTSLPLLKNTIAAAIQQEPSEARSEFSGADDFRQPISAIPDQRFLTCYVNLPRLSAEFRPLRRLYALDGPERDVWAAFAGFPLITITLDTYPTKLVIEAELSAALEMANVSSLSGVNGSTESQETFGDVPNLEMLDKLVNELAVIGVFHRQRLKTFLHLWQTLFPQYEWALPLVLPELEDAVFTDVVECRLTKTLTGTIYMLPDMACVVETQAPEPAMLFLDASVQSILTQTISPTIQQMIIKRVREVYQNSVIAKVQFTFQDVLNYVTTAGPRPPFYTILGTNLAIVKTQLDALQANSDQPPFLFPLQGTSPTLSENSDTPSTAPQSAFALVIQNVHLADLLHNLFQSNTFALLLPRQHYPQLYQTLPTIIQALKSSPPMLVEGGGKETGVYVVIQMNRSEFRDREAKNEVFILDQGSALESLE